MKMDKSPSSFCQGLALSIIGVVLRSRIFRFRRFSRVGDIISQPGQTMCRHWSYVKRNTHSIGNCLQSCIIIGIICLLQPCIQLPIANPMMTVSGRDSRELEVVEAAVGLRCRIKESIKDVPDMLEEIIGDLLHDLNALLQITRHEISRGDEASGTGLHDK